MIKDKADKALDENPQVKKAIDTTAKVAPVIAKASNQVTKSNSTADKIKAVANAVPKIIESV